ncbi:MAG: proteasome regulatory particle base subunit [Chaenotheca gracillima]|nr:MAG: proteasome regulatory particle base subunit [Chaenotheca gracillima]
MASKAAVTLISKEEYAPPKQSGPVGTTDVRIVTPSEYREAAVSLARAFEHDPTSRYPLYTKDMEEYSDEYKYQLHASILECLVYAYTLSGLVTTVGPDYASVALISPPGTSIDDWVTIFRSGFWRLYFKLSGEGSKRFFNEFLPLLHDTKQSVMGDRDNDSYYLVYLGTKPGEEGKGYGKALIEHMTRQADAEGRACYLESSAVKNNGMYERRGFRMKRKIYLSRGEVPIPIDIMVREPANPAKSSGTATTVTTNQTGSFALTVDMEGLTGVNGGSSATV